MTASTANTAPATRATGKSGFLRFALRLDAILTAVMGLAGTALAPRIAEISGTSPAFEYAMGASFIAYGVIVYGLSLMQHVRVPGIAIIVGNVLYAVGAVAFVVSGLFPLTTTGIVATLASGVFTLVMADLQYVGVRRLRA